MIEHSQIAEIFVPIFSQEKKKFISVELKWSLMIPFTETLQATLDHFLISGVQSLAGGWSFWSLASVSNLC